MTMPKKHGQQQQSEFILAPDLARQAQAKVDADNEQNVQPQVATAAKGNKVKNLNKRRAVEFAASHGLLIVFFLWLLYETTRFPTHRCLLTMRQAFFRS